MSEHFITVVDSLFVPQSRLLYLSLKRHVHDAVVWVLCVDQAALQRVRMFGDPDYRGLDLADFETRQLKEVRKERTRGEYCWTLTPFAPSFAFSNKKEIDRITYVDADMWFLQSTSSLFDEFETSKKDILITEHHFDASNDMSTTAGRFCVQFMTFNRNGSERVLDWWQQKCLDWCFAYFDEGRFGDQMYLNSWPELFGSSVHILQQPNAFVAPWNFHGKSLSNAVAYHFHGLRYVSNRQFFVGEHPIPKNVFRDVYNPYMQAFKKVSESLSDAGFEVNPQAKSCGFFRSTLLKIKSLAKIWMHNGPSHYYTDRAE